MSAELKATVVARRRREVYELADEAKERRILALHALNRTTDPAYDDIYAPRGSQFVPPSGAWAMICRQLPAIEGGIDAKITIGRVFWVEPMEGADEEGFSPDGTYKVRCRSPFGDVTLWAFEYGVLSSDFLVRAWQEEAIKFHPTGLSHAQFTDQVFYAQSRGIDLADAVVMSLGTITGPVGWFEPLPEVVEYVQSLRRFPYITAKNRERRAATHALESK